MLAKKGLQWHGGRAACFVLWSILKRSVIPRDWIKLRHHFLTLLPFPFAFPTAYPWHYHVHQMAQCGQFRGGNLPGTGNQTSKCMHDWEGFILADLVHSPMSTGHASEGGVSFSRVAAGNLSY